MGSHIKAPDFNISWITVNIPAGIKKKTCKFYLGVGPLSFFNAIDLWILQGFNLFTEWCGPLFLFMNISTYLGGPIFIKASPEGRLLESSLWVYLTTDFSKNPRNESKAHNLNPPDLIFSSSSCFLHAKIHLAHETKYYLHVSSHWIIACLINSCI